MDYWRLSLLVILSMGGATAAGAAEESLPPLRSRTEAALDYPIRVVEAEPYWRPAEEKRLTSEEGLFHAAHRPLGTLPAERLRLLRLGLRCCFRRRGHGFRRRDLERL